MCRFSAISILLTFTMGAIAIGALAQDAPEVRVGEVSVKQVTVLRASPANSAVMVQRIPSGTKLRWIEGQKKGNFVRVMIPKGRQGWVAVNDVEIVSQPPAPILTAASAPPCVTNLDECTEMGCAAPDSTHALFNETKRRIPPDTTPIPMTFSDFALIQDQATELVDQGQELSAADRALITNLQASGGTVGEGSVVRLVGFIAQGLDPHANSGESVNCRLRREVNNDFHISLAERPTESEFAGIVVEMIPQDRNSAWTLTKLKTLKTQRQKVMVIGALFYDNAHIVNSDPSNPLPGQPKRFSLWEIHPTTKFFVCRRTNNSCNPDNAGDWRPL